MPKIGKALFRPPFLSENIYESIKPTKQNQKKEKKNFLIKFNDTENCVIDYQVHTYFAYVVG